MGDCWKVEPKERIDFRKILAELRSMHDDSKLNRECELFLTKRKDSWKRAIEEQITQLKVILFSDLKLKLSSTHQFSRNYSQCC